VSVVKVFNNSVALQRQKYCESFQNLILNSTKKSYDLSVSYCSIFGYVSVRKRKNYPLQKWKLIFTNLWCKNEWMSVESIIWKQFLVIADTQMEYESRIWIETPVWKCWHKGSVDDINEWWSETMYLGYSSNISFMSYNCNIVALQQRQTIGCMVRKRYLRKLTVWSMGNILHNKMYTQT